MSMTRSEGRKQPTPQVEPVVIGNVTVYPITTYAGQQRFLAGIVAWCDWMDENIARRAQEAAHAAD